MTGTTTERNEPPQTLPEAANITLPDQTNQGTGLDLLDRRKGDCPP